MMSAIVRVKVSDGNFIRARALLDTCASAHFITHDLARKLNLPVKSCSIPVSAINDMNTISKGKVDVTLSSIHSEFNKKLSFLVVQKIADFIPSEIFPRDEINIPANLKLADPEFHIPRTVDLIIGSGATLSLLCIGQINLSNNLADLILQKTMLGWVIVGSITKSSGKKSVSCKLTDLTQQIAKFWQLEDITAEKRQLTKKSECELFFNKTTTRDPSSGRYVVRLPFKTNDREFTGSRGIALRRFYGLQRKFNADPIFKQQYARAMNEYIDLGYISLADQEHKDGFYLPHHAVIKSTSATTKLRIVFDASAKTSKGISLNDALMVGPTIQDKLFKHLLKFRIHKYVLTADIEKMYLQVLLHPDDWKYQQIFWYYNDEIRVFVIKVVAFGEGPSSYLAIAAVTKLAEDEGTDLPIGAKTVEEDLYVDNLQTGADTYEELMQIIDQTTELLKRGGFVIRQWASNNLDALQYLSRRPSDIELLTSKNSINKTLGISWNSKEDLLFYNVQPIFIQERITKRHILSEIAKIFDPLGLLGPVILISKIIMQECWKSKVDWDESVPNALHTSWSKFAEQIPLINEVSVERRILIDNSNNIQVHGFCDASKVGYGACLYIRSCNSEHTLVRLFCAKVRVAPLKEANITIPRLELCAALTLSRLYQEVQTSFTFKPDKVLFWSDSTIVLGWLKKSPEVLKIFEANRVKEIQNTCKNIEWRHIYSEHNPADILSRGQYPREFSRNQSWLHGPAWLRKPEVSWPESRESIPDDLPGMKKVSCLVSKIDTDNIFERFSSFNRLKRSIAYCLRLKVRKNLRPYTTSLSLEELKEAEQCILRCIQRQKFATEIDHISKTKKVTDTKLASFCPFLDECNLLRVGGRLKNANLPNSVKHPILLPSKHHVTDLIIREIHLKNFHSGIQSTLYNIRHKYWLIDGKNQVRKIIKHCIKCIRFQAKPIDYKMADLPKHRTETSVVFHNTGIDFFGPMFIKEKKYRNKGRIKVYGAVFVCMSSKAVHIEIVSDLTTEAFLAALKRFIGRRGIPAHFHSDNGRTFVGANNQLKELYTLLNSEHFQAQIEQFCTVRQISWHFIPPLSPWFGGLWEAAVKSFKHHFKRVVGDLMFTYEELNTLAIEIEAILNSRPLCTLSSDPNDPLALTPAHLLIGQPLTMLPEDNYISVSENRLSSWRLITKARQDFWRRWQIEYLNELQRRQKWLNTASQLEIDSIVLIIDKDQPCMRWQLGRIVEVHPGNDGVVRVATVKTAKSSFKRNTRMLCPLPVKA